MKRLRLPRVAVRVFRKAQGAAFLLASAAVAAPAGMVAHWPMDGLRGTLLPDVSGNEHHAAARHITLIKGVDGTGASFDGINSYLSAATSPALELRDALTLEAWVRPQVSTMGGFPSVIRKDMAYALRFTDRTLGFLLWMNGDVKTLSTKYRKWESGTWYHVAATYDGENMRLYVDGEEVPNSPLPMTGKIDMTGSACGIGSSSGQYVLNGTLDEVRIYSRALGQSEIKQSEQQGRAALRAQADISVEPVVIGENRPVFRKPQPEAKMVEDGYFWIDAEDFADYGGWTLDTQFVHLMGSGYLLATGIGKPVKDAVTTIDVPKAGTYRMWVRARNWMREHAPGQFQLLVNGTAVDTSFGAADTDTWVWEDGGRVALGVGPVELAIRDLTGYYGRCDAIVLTTDMAYTPPADREGVVQERARLTGLSLAPTEAGTFDVIVVGAGSAGCPAAISAARMGARTALIQNRPVLGGNSSSECGVPLNGAGALKANAREGGIAAEVGRIRARYGYRKYSESFRILADAEPNLTVFTNRHVFDVIMDGAERIAGVKAVDTLTGAISIYRGTQFVDCTGDGWVGYFAKAEYRLGREAKHEYGEDLAPEATDKITMSGCIMGNALGFRAISIGEPAHYTPPPWAPKLPPREEFGRNVRHVAGGEWWLEHPGTVDDLWEAEFARDELIRITFAYWGFIKNQSKLKDQAETFVLSTVPYMDAKRESRRLIGDYVLNQNDVLGARIFTDRISYGGWPLDIHHPKGIFSGREGPFDYNAHTPLYTIPYRCLYSKNIENLLFAGRCASVSHVALGSVRVQSTLSTLGQAAGTAAGMCIRHSTTPRGIYHNYIADLQQELVKQDQYIPGVPNRDPRDLARNAKVTASSTASYTLFDKRSIQADDLHPMTTDRAVSFPTHAGQRIDRIELLLKSDLPEPFPLTLHLRAGDNSMDFSSDQDILTATADIPAKKEGWVSFDIDRVVDVSALHVWLPAAAGIHWRLMANAPVKCHRAYGRAKSAAWTVVESQRYAFCTVPPLEIPTTFKEENVNNGYSRIIGDDANMWASDPTQPMPQWIELDFGDPVELNTVHLTFDTNMDTKWPNIPIPRESVRDYRVSWLDGDKWATAVTEKGNFMRHRTHPFDTVRTSRLRITVDVTNGDRSARIFEVRAYRE